MSTSYSLFNLGLEAWYTAVVVVLMVVALIKEWRGPEVILGGALALLLIGGVLTTSDALTGFSNAGVLTIAALFVVAQAVQEAGGLGQTVIGIMGNSKELKRTLLRLMPPITIISAFMNNTPVVAMFVPAVRRWASRNDVAPSKLLIPLSYASILGGMCTLIGTSTNLVVSGMMTDHGFDGIGMFEISRVGLPIAFVGLVFMLTIGRHLLPERRDVAAQLAEEQREYLVEMKVSTDCPLVGKTIEDARLRGLKGLFLVHIERGDQVIGPVPPSETMRAEDQLFFTGMVSTIVDLKAIRGLEPANETSLAERSGSQDGDLRLFEVVIAPSSPLVGVGVRDAGFRGMYDAAVIAVHRSGQRIVSKVGDIVLRAGDTLLLEAAEEFRARWYNSLHFYLVSMLGDVKRVKHEKARLVLVILITMVALPALGVIPMVASAIGAAALLVTTGCLSTVSARRSIDLSVLIVIAAALGIGKAVESTGLAALVAENLVAVVAPYGAFAVLLAVMLLTNLFTELVTNKAAAALFFPVALAAAALIDADPRPFMISVAVAAAASFATPLGYQTNLIVYGPGGYKFSDFLKIGVPMNLLTVLVGALSIFVAWHL